MELQRDIDKPQLVFSQVSKWKLKINPIQFQHLLHLILHISLPATLTNEVYFQPHAHRQCGRVSVVSFPFRHSEFSSWLREDIVTMNENLDKKSQDILLPLSQFPALLLRKRKSPCVLLDLDSRLHACIYSSPMHLCIRSQVSWILYIWKSPFVYSSLFPCFLSALIWWSSLILFRSWLRPPTRKPGLVKW